MHYNIAEISSFLKFLDPVEKCFHFWLQAREESAKPYLGNFVATVEELPAILDRYPEGMLHVTLNQTDGVAKRSDNITSCRVLCVDLDKEITDECVAELITVHKVAWAVSSSPGRYHLYWKLRPEIKLLQWQIFQAGLAQIFSEFGADSNLSSLSKTIRVPGVDRVKNGEIFRPFSLELGEYSELGYNGVLELFPGIRKAEKKLQRKEKKLTERLNTLAPGVKLSSADLNGTGRHVIANKFGFKEAMRRLHCKEECTFEGMCQFLQEVNTERFLEPLEEWEVARVARSVVDGAERKFEESVEVRAEKEKEINSHLTPITVEERATPLFKYNYNDRFMKTERFSDKGILIRVQQRFGESLVRTGKLIYAFDDSAKVWRSQKQDKEILTGFVEECCLDVIADPQFKTVLCADKKGEEDLKKEQSQRIKFLSNKTIGSTTDKVSNIKEIKRMDIGEFDNDPYKLFVGNGVLDLKNRSLKEHAAASDYLLERTPVNYKEGATCPKWLTFVSQICANQEEKESQVNFLQEIFGYSLTGLVNEQVVFVHNGGGCNGKSKTLDAIGYLLGSYKTRLDCKILTKKKSALETEFNRIGAKLQGKRVAILDDLDTGSQWNEGFIKSLTGDKIVARNLYAEEADIPNRAKIHIGCNKVPDPEGQSFGIARRIIPVNYTARFKLDPVEGDRITRETLEELPGILNWALDGLERMRGENRGIKYPENCVESIEEYRANFFKIEATIDRLFERIPVGNPPTDEEKTHAKSMDHLVALGDLVGILNEDLQNQGDNSKVNEDQLGRLLVEKQFVRCRQWVGKLRPRFYFVNVRKELKTVVDRLL